MSNQSQPLTPEQIKELKEKDEQKQKSVKQGDTITKKPDNKIK